MSIFSSILTQIKENRKTIIYTLFAIHYIELNKFGQIHILRGGFIMSNQSSSKVPVVVVAVVLIAAILMIVVVPFSSGQ